MQEGRYTYVRSRKYSEDGDPRKMMLISDRVYWRFSSEVFRTEEVKGLERIGDSDEYRVHFRRSSADSRVGKAPGKVSRIGKMSVSEVEFGGNRSMGSGELLLLENPDEVKLYGRPLYVVPWRDDDGDDDRAMPERTPLERIDIDSEGRLRNISIYRFSVPGEGNKKDYYWHVVYDASSDSQSFRYDAFPGDRFFLGRFPKELLDIPLGNPLTDLWSYFRSFIRCSERFNRDKFLDETNVSPVVLTDDEADRCRAFVAMDRHNFLLPHFDKVSSHREDGTLLSDYLNGRVHPFSGELSDREIIYPFGGNTSQVEAVRRALSNGVSVIQGPPGTGKTQTILNILANILYRGKTALVVSGTNAAVDNVFEKLKEAGLMFLVARLGKSDLVKFFYNEQQTLTYNCSDMVKEWNKLRGGIERNREILRKNESLVSDIYERRLRVSGLRQVINEARSILDEAGRDASLVQAAAWWDRVSSQDDLETVREALHRGVDGSLLERLASSVLVAVKSRSLGGRPKEGGFESWRALDYACCVRMLDALQAKVDAMEKDLQVLDPDRVLKEYYDASFNLLKAELAERYFKRIAKRAARKDGGMYGTKVGNVVELKADEEFLKDFPIVTSTDFSCHACFDRDCMFDYVIMDETSLMGVAKGAVALSMARNAVIVGDGRQLPAVTGTLDEAVALWLDGFYKVPRRYDVGRTSFLESVTEVWPESKETPYTLLREHYRCHPRIIGFCNRMFYGGRLVCMRQDNGEKGVLEEHYLVEGSHAKLEADGGKRNRREQDVITDLVEREVKPLEKPSDLGVIVPYRNQSENIEKTLKKKYGDDGKNSGRSRNLYKSNSGDKKVDRPECGTVHKFQGRDRRTVVFGVTSNRVQADSFCSGDSLVNVAVSRAKDRLVLVLPGNRDGISPSSNIGILSEYIRSHGGGSTVSTVSSVFDLLYECHSEEFEMIRKRSPRFRGSGAELLAYDVIRNAVCELGLGSRVRVRREEPLANFLGEDEREALSGRERSFLRRSKLDFVLYHCVGRSVHPVLCVEIDGQQHRLRYRRRNDAFKDEVIEGKGIPMKRYSTEEVLTKDRFKEDLEEAMVSQGFQI